MYLLCLKQLSSVVINLFYFIYFQIRAYCASSSKEITTAPSESELEAAALTRSNTHLASLAASYDLVCLHWNIRLPSSFTNINICPGHKRWNSILRVKSTRNQCPQGNHSRRWRSPVYHGHESRRRNSSRTSHYSGMLSNYTKHSPYLHRIPSVLIAGGAMQGEAGWFRSSSLVGTVVTGQ